MEYTKSQGFAGFQPQTAADRSEMALANFGSADKVEIEKPMPVDESTYDPAYQEFKTKTFGEGRRANTGYGSSNDYDFDSGVDNQMLLTDYQKENDIEVTKNPAILTGADAVSLGIFGDKKARDRSINPGGSALGSIFTNTNNSKRYGR